MPTRNASAHWNGTLRNGSGEFSGETGIGGAYNFTSRFEPGTTGSNPEELLAAAHAGCFSMALAGNLEKAGAAPERVLTDAACTVEPQPTGGFRITTMKLRTRVKATGIDAAKFAEVAEATKAGCPVSGALQNNVRIELDAALE